MAAGLSRFKSMANVELGDMSGSGLVASYGNMDRHGDVILPGAFSQDVIERFMRESGSVNLDHWSPLQIGFATSLVAGTDGLRGSWKYHSTDEAKAAYTVAKERQAAGLPTGLSVGFQIGDYAEFSSGEALWDWLAKGGFNLSLFDEAGIKGRERTCWAITEASDLYEWSQVTTGANPKALTDQIKSFLRDPETLGGTDLDSHFEAALAAASGVAARIKSLQTMRDKDGRTVSTKRLEQAEKLVLQLSGLIDDVKNKAHVPVSIDVDKLRLEAELLELEN